MKFIYVLVFLSFNVVAYSQTSEGVIENYFLKNGGRIKIGNMLKNYKQVSEFYFLDEKILVKHTEFTNFPNKEKTVAEWKQLEDSINVESIQVFNGKVGSQLFFMNKILMQTEDFSEYKIAQKKNESSLLDACKSVKESGDSATYEGIEEFNNIKCYKIKYIKSFQNYDTTSNDINLEYHFFDISTSLEIGIKNFDKNNIETTTIIEGFSTINGLNLPQKTRLMKNGKLFAIMTLKEFKSDIILPEKEFEKENYIK